MQFRPCKQSTDIRAQAGRNKLNVTGLSTSPLRRGPVRQQPSAEPASGEDDGCSGAGLREEGFLLSEIAWHQREEPFRLFVESVQDYAIFMLDPEGRIVTWNAGAERAKGYKASEIIGRHFSSFYSAEDVRAGRPQRLLDLALREGRVEDEGWRVRKDGSQFWANVTITAVRDAAGKLIGFGKVTRDLTAHRRADLALRHSEERSRLFIEAVQDYAIFMLDPEGSVITWNAGAERIKGYKAAEIVGQHFSRFYPEEDVRGGKPAGKLEEGGRKEGLRMKAGACGRMDRGSGPM